jgi:hypothetical protein
VGLELLNLTCLDLVHWRLIEPSGTMVAGL